MSGMCKVTRIYLPLVVYSLEDKGQAIKFSVCKRSHPPKKETTASSLEQFEEDAGMYPTLMTAARSSHEAV